MKSLLPLSLAAICVTSHAHADELKGACIAAAKSQGVDEKTCECIVEALSEDEALMDEYLAISSQKEFANASPSLKDAVSHCPWN